MRLIALLNWYDEPAWCLTELIASLAGAGVDHLVAIDGAYAAFPGGKPRSPTDQAQAIVAATQGAGIGLTLHVPQDLWYGDEIEKRTFAFDLGHRVGGLGDWLYVADADEVVTESCGLREALEQTRLEAGEVVLDQITADGHQGQLLIRKLFRWQRLGIRLEGNHYTYATGDGRVLWHGPYGSHCSLVEAEAMHFVRVEHRQGNRPKRREEDFERYLLRRVEMA